MTRILSTQTLKALRSSSLTSPTKKAIDPSPRTPPTDSFEAPKKTASLRNDGDGFEAPVDGVIALAQSVMGERAHDLKLANDTELGAAMQDGVADNVNCANFVSGLLITTGRIPKDEGNASVTGLVANLKEDPNFTQTSLDQAVPGDVVAFKTSTGHHVVVFAGRDANGQPKFIGSDNVNSDGTQSVHESTGVKSGRKVIAVMHYTGSGEVSSNSTTTESGTTTAPGLRRGASGPAVKDLQQRLGDAGFNAGPVDGSFGPKTEAGVRAYQQAKGLEVDGVVSPELTALLGEEPPVKREVSSTGSDLEALALKKNGPEFVQQVKEMSDRLGVKSDWVLAVMKNESGMSPSARNPNGGASGLIQFMPSTAKGLGTTTSALRQMSAVEQLKYVEKYYAPFKGKISSGTDLYLATFYPAGVGKSDGYALGGSKVANANPIFDLNRDGQITAGEFRQYYRNRFPELA